MSGLIDFGLLVLEIKIIFKIFSVILLFCYYLPLERGTPLYFDKLESLLQRMSSAKSG
jgi:dolichol kinase